MNIGDIEKVANRKRINAEAEKLREKVTRETENIIKLKVAQDTAYWDLKEKLHQRENNHERLQQNMVEVQMQYETISGQYQDELRLRPETLNKLSSTREICDVLEEFSERLKATLSRCKADQATLAQAYNKSGQLVRDIKGQHIQTEEKSQQVIQNLREKIKLDTEHREQMTQLFASAKQHLEAELNDARAKLATTMGQKDELFVALNDFSRKLDHFKHELDKKDENISSLQVEMKKLVNKYSNDATDMKNLLIKKEKDLKEFSDANETLKKALQNQDQYSKSTCEQNNQLQEKIYSLEEEQIALSNKLKETEIKFEEANALCNQLMKEIEKLNEKNTESQNEVAEKIMLLEQAEIEHQNLKANMSALETEKSQVVADLKEVTQESDLKSDEKAVEANALCNQLMKEIEKLNEKNTELQNVVAEKIMLLEQAEIEHQNLKANMSALETEKSQVVADLKEVTQESDLKSDKNKELVSVNQNLEAQLAEMKCALENLKIEHSNQINELHMVLESKDKAIEIKDKANEIKDKAIEIKDKSIESKDKTIEIKDKELDCKATTINQMMSDLKNMTDANSKLENKMKAMEVEKEILNEKVRALTWNNEQLDISVKNKEVELSKQMAVILDIRNEKVKLQDRLKVMQNTIDNVQKEVTGRNTMTPQEAPEQDDNAVMMTPILLQKKIGIHASKKPPLSKVPPPQVQKKQQDLMYNLFSDSSMENDLAIDSEEINRRFEAVARGEAMSPLIVKRRKGPPVTLGGLKPLADNSASANSVAPVSNKKRTFFKSKRSDNKEKKFKPED